MLWGRYWCNMGGSTGTFRGPTKEELLCCEYPDLGDKYRLWLDERSRLSELGKEINSFQFYEKMISTKRYKEWVERITAQELIVQDAEIDYELMKKMVWDYE